MKFDLVVTRKARQEAMEALTYYDSLQPGLGDSFISVLEEKLAAIAENPYAYSYLDNKMLLRDTLFNRFQYLVIFKIKAKHVIVVAVRNRHKRPFHATH